MNTGKHNSGIVQNSTGGNIKHYIDQIKTGGEYFTIEKKFSTIMMVAALSNVVLAVLFYIMQIYALCILSSIAIFFYSSAMRRLVRKGKYSSMIVGTLCEVILFSFLGTIYTGSATAFSMYEIVLITASFYCTFVIDSFQKKEFIPFVFSVLAFVCYILIYVAMLFIQPVYTLDAKWIHFLHLYNSTISFALIIVFSFLLVWEIKLSNNKLTAQNIQLDEMANIDPLTKLFNRRSMTKYLNDSMDNLKLRGKRFSIILGDIDDFKRVNDTYGHDAGDLVLTSIADIIKKNVRENDYVCRWGGEEILILINDPLETAVMAAERIRKHIEEETITYNGQKINITMTFGLSESIPGYRIEHLIQQADDKLYEGKKSGKNKVVI